MTTFHVICLIHTQKNKKMTMSHFKKWDMCQTISWPSRSSPESGCLATAPDQEIVPNIIHHKTASCHFHTWIFVPSLNAKPCYLSPGWSQWHQSSGWYFFQVKINLHGNYAVFCRIIVWLWQKITAFSNVFACCIWPRACSFFVFFCPWTCP